MNNKFLKKPFNNILIKDPVEYKNGILYFGSELEGDQFNEDDINIWVKKGGFANRWQNKGILNEYKNDKYMELCKKAGDYNLPILDIASGPGLGLIPDIYSYNKNIHFLATDGCPILVEKWNEYFIKNEPNVNIQFISLDVNNMPIKDDSIDIITSNIGLSSIRNIVNDRMLSVNEIYRVLKPGGYIFTIENEFEDKVVIQKVFDLWRKDNWFKNEKMTWHERFEKAGFKIESEKLHFRRIEKNDWELGEVATSFGIEIVIISKAYILRK